MTFFFSIPWLYAFFIFYFFKLEEHQGVSIGGGIGSITDILDAAQMICEKVCLSDTVLIFTSS